MDISVSCASVISSYVIKLFIVQLKLFYYNLNEEGTYVIFRVNCVICIYKN